MIFLAFYLLRIDAPHSISVGGRNALNVCLPTATKSKEEEGKVDGNVFKKKQWDKKGEEKAAGFTKLKGKWDRCEVQGKTGEKM